MASDVLDWLADIGLAEYSDAFSNNAIDLALLPHLTEDDLKSLGVEKLGDRKRLLLAIGEFQDPSKSVSSPAPTVAPREAERRLMSILFCDLVGSTELSRQMDPEDYREIIRQYQDAVSLSVQRYEGHVGKLMGDGVLAYFGWPLAFEDQSERAVRAGLDAIHAVAALQKGPTANLRSRVGIATGEVVVGDLVGDAVADAETVLGETPNLAARLQSAAAPDQVVIDNVTRRMVGSVFETSSLGNFDLKGFEPALELWGVSGEKQIESRFDASAPRSLSKFVGRENELGLLIERWKLAKGGEGQVLLVSGEPGIGKSRLIQALRDAVGKPNNYRLRYQCSPHHANSAFYPVVQRLNRDIGILTDDPAKTRLQKLEEHLRVLGADLATEIPLFASLLNVPLDERYSEPDISAQARRARTIDALVRYVISLSRSQPLLLILEDAHWIDPTTEALIGEVMSRTEDAAVFMVITHRPEYASPYADQPHLSSLALGRLGRKQVAQIVRAVSENELTEDLIDRIVDRADGVPLYVEELAKSVLESGAQSQDIKAATEVPMSLQASLVSRLDRLGPAKEIAQIGSVVGRSFSHQLITAVAASSVDNLSDALDSLVASGLVNRRGEGQEANYVFKHALVQDVAYSTLLRDRKRKTHAEIAHTLEAISPEAVSTTPELLGRHWTEAGERERAIQYWGEAGKLAARRAANHEAASHLKTGLQLADELPASRQNREAKLGMLVTLGPVFMATKGYGAPDVRDVYQEMKTLAASEIGTADQYFAATFGLWLHYQGRADFKAAREAISELFQIAEQEQSDDYQLQARHAAWTTGLNTGEFQESKQFADEAATIYNRDAHQHHYMTYAGHDPGACQITHDAMALWFLGFPVRAQQQTDKSISTAIELAHPPTEVVTRFFGLITLQFLRLTQDVSETAPSVIELTRRHGPLTWHAAAKVISGWSAAVQGRVTEGLQECRDAIAAYNKSGNVVRLPYYLGLQAEVCCLADELGEGISALDIALQTSKQTGDQHWDAELYRLKGELFLAEKTTQSTQQAEEQYRLALSVSQQQKAKSLELRASTSLAQLLQRTGRTDEAKYLLQNVYDWFTEGHDLPDLVSARSVLAGLG